MVLERLMKIATATAVLGLVAVFAPGVAEAAVPVASGTVSCPVLSGNGTLNPGLTAGGSGHSVKISFTANLGSTPAAGCSSSATLPSGASVNITSGTLTAGGFFNAPAGALADSCSMFDGPDIVGKITAKVHWTGAVPAIAPSKIVYKGGTPAVSGAPTDTISLPAPGGVTHKHGSFHTPPVPDLVKLVTNIPSSCPGTVPPGITTFTITGGTVSL
jgi:hypothetical protein